MLFSQRQHHPGRCGVDFTTSKGGGAGGEWVSLLVYVLVAGWSLGRELYGGKTQESCSTTVAEILKGPD
jgi:hypothetical protein